MLYKVRSFQENLVCMPFVWKKQLLPTIENEAISSTVLGLETFTAAINTQMM